MLFTQLCINYSCVYTLINVMWNPGDYFSGDIL